MNVFLSWSGSRSKEVSEAFEKWLPTVITTVEPFISQHSIEKGSVGQNQLSQSLEETNCGIICLTKDNLHHDWILYEAGALSKYKDSRVWTFLLDIKPVNISGPLSKFQHTNFVKEEVFQLLQSINKTVNTKVGPIKDVLLEEIFNYNWERLNKILLVIREKEADTKEPDRDLLDINTEVLEVVRRQENITQKLIKQNEDLSRSLSQIANQLPRGGINPYAYTLQPIRVTGPRGNIVDQPSTSEMTLFGNIGLQDQALGVSGLQAGILRQQDQTLGVSGLQAEILRPQDQALGVSGISENVLHPDSITPSKKRINVSKSTKNKS